MKLIEIMEDYFRGFPGIFSLVVGNDLMISWHTIQSQMDGGELAIDLCRDHLLIRQVGNDVMIKRVDCGEKILHEKPWRVMDIHDPKLLSELHRIILNL